MAFFGSVFVGLFVEVGIPGRKKCFLWVKSLGALPMPPRYGYATWLGDGASHAPVRKDDPFGGCLVGFKST